MKTSLSLQFFAVSFCVYVLGVTQSTAIPTITFQQDEIQHLVYAGHLLTLIDNDPELESGMILLLELDRRNPDADPELIVNAVQSGLEGYRQNIKSKQVFSPTREVLLADFMDYFLGNVEHQSLRPATLSIVNSLVQDSYAASEGSKIRTHSGNYDVLGKEKALLRCQEQIDTVLVRAHDSSRFRRILNSFLLPETSVKVSAEPQSILSVNDALATSPTMQMFANLYNSAATGPVDVELSELENLYVLEMANLKETISENQLMLKDLNRSQVELSEYLSDERLIEATRQTQESARLGQAGRISASSAATHVICFSMKASTAEKAKQMRTLANSTAALARGMQAIDAAGKFSKLSASTNFLAAGLGLVSLFIDTGPSPEEIILEEINALKQMIHDLATHIDYRFDRVDQTLNVVLDQLDYSIQLIGETGHDVDEIRLDLLDVEAGLCRLEREIFNYLSAGFRRTFVEHLNGDLQYEFRTGTQMMYGEYSETGGPENIFYSWAVSHSFDELSSYRPVPDDLTDEALSSQLQARPLENNLNYINKFLNQRLGVPELSSKWIANPRDWFTGADAYLNLAVENPLHYRRMSLYRMNELIKVGEDLEDFFGSFSLTNGSGVNYQLFDAVLNYYDASVDIFMNEVETEANQHAFVDMNEFAYAQWRDWNEQTSPEILEEAAVSGFRKVVRVPSDVISIDSGGEHFLALRSNGTVIAWGYNGSGQCDVPPTATDVIAVEAGASHSLALKADGTVIAWGYNSYGECDVPEGLSNVIKIDAGPHHNIALRSDGTVAIWGNRTDAPQLQVPEGLTDVVDIAAGGDSNRDTGSFCVVLKSDKTVVAWGDNGNGQCDVPLPLANGSVDVVQVAAMMEQSAAVLANGVVIGWPDLIIPNGLVDELSLFNWDRQIALLKDGTVEVIMGSSDGVPTSDDIIQIGPGMALHADGRVSTWGTGSQKQLGDACIQSIAGSKDNIVLLMQDGTVQALWSNLNPPGDLPLVKQIDVGSLSSSPWVLALTEDGEVVAWGNNSVGQCDVLDGLSDVVAISASHEGGHSLALKRDGSVEAWGANDFGQSNVPTDLVDVVAISAGWRHSAAVLADGKVRIWGGGGYYGFENIPSDLNNAVAISSGYMHILALRADGTVEAWGTNNEGECSVPAGLDNVVAIGAGFKRSLALKADGSVVSWGADGWGSKDRANAMTGVFQLVCGGYDGDIFLVDNEFVSQDDGVDFAYVRRTPYSQAVTEKISILYNYVMSEIPFDLNDSGSNLSAAKDLMTAVVALALPTSFEQDDVLRGYLLGTEGLADKETSQTAYQREIVRLQTSRWVRPRDMKSLFKDRLAVFQQRLYGRLEDIEASGIPEKPRMLSHTLKLLKILRFAHNSGETSSPVFDFSQMEIYPSALSLPLYGEPYIHYNMNQSSTLGGWQTTGLTVHDGDAFFMETDFPQQSVFYQALVHEAP